MAVFKRSYLFAIFASAALVGCETVPESGGTSDTGTANSAETAYDDGVTHSGTGDDSVDGSVQDGGLNSGGVGNAGKNVDSALSETTVYFDFDRANIRPEAYAILKAHAGYLSAHPAAKLRMDGHADERGTREYNLALGERRAKSAADYLTANGASRAQLEVISYGEEKPAVMASNEDSWAKNRRVELKYTSVAP